MHVFCEAVALGNVPQAPEISRALKRPENNVRAWYKDKVKPDWRRHTLEATEALLPSIGLTGTFWNLRS